MNLSTSLKFSNLLSKVVACNCFFNVKNIGSANAFLFMILVICAFSSSL